MEIELPNGDVVDLGADPTPDLIGSVKAKIAERFPELRRAPETSPGLLESAGEAFNTQARRVADAASSVLTSDRSVMGRVGDVATLVAPVLAPGLTAAGVGAQTLARTAGMSREGAETIGDVTAGVAGVGGMLRSGYKVVKGLQAAKVARAASTEAAATAATEAIPAATATAESASQAAQVAAGAGAREALATSTPELAGATVQRSIPAAATEARTAVQTRLYDPVAGYFERTGKALTPGGPGATTLATSLESTADKWGALLGGQEKTQLVGLLTKLRGSVGKAVPVTYADLDAAKLALSKVRGASSVRKAVGDAIMELAEGTPAAAKLRAAGVAWNVAVKPAEKLAKKVAAADTAAKAFQVAIGSHKDAGRARMSMQLLGARSPEWTRVTGGFFDDVFRKANGSGTKAAGIWTKAAPEVQQLMDPSGRAGMLFAGLARLEAQEAVRVGAATAGAQATAQGARTAADAAAEALKPAWSMGPAGKIVRRSIGGIETASGINDLVHGRWKSAAIKLTIAGGVQFAGPAAVTFAKGAVGSPSARALAVSVMKWSTDKDGPAQEAANEVATELNGGDTVSAPEEPITQESDAPAANDVDAVARVVGIDPTFLNAVIARESGGNPNAVSEVGARGLMQVMPDTFERLRPRVEALLGREASLDYPLDNLTAGAILYKDHLDANNGDVARAAMLYHGGTNPANHGPKTKAYAAAVAATYRQMAGESPQ